MLNEIINDKHAIQKPTAGNKNIIFQPSICVFNPNFLFALLCNKDCNIVTTQIFP